jgi:hypothetical protein
VRPMPVRGAKLAVCPTWDWARVPDLFSAKAGHPGMNLSEKAGVTERHSNKSQP